jgi:arginyl-tRNA synthetase
MGNLPHIGATGKISLELKEIIGGAIDSAVLKGALPQPEGPFEFVVEIPADSSHGDLSSNVAMASAKSFRRAPRLVAQSILDHLSLEDTSFKSAQIAGPGFLNFLVKDNWYCGVVSDILCQKNNYGKTSYGRGERVMVEFVSANPTGPMHMGNARGGAIGDCIAEILKYAGYSVSREFYINDAGNQIDKFALSLEARYLQHFLKDDAPAFPEDGYHGDDITEHVKNFIEHNGDVLLALQPQERQKVLVEYALPQNIEKMKRDLLKYRIEFDCWFSESSLHKEGGIEKTINSLGKLGLTYEKDGALWYRAGRFGSDKDEVLVRANGFPTYFAADIAYHTDKFCRRGFDRCINVWGADHHGHVERLKGAMDAIGVGGDRLEIVLMQLVRLTRAGEPVRMSKRAGTSVTLSQLLDEVPVDAARFFFNMREPNSALDFDLALAVEQSNNNPVYYVQYAHARICSVLKNVAAEGYEITRFDPKNFSLLTDPAERSLIRQLSLLPDEIISAAKQYDPARLTHYAIETASRFHRFYSACRCKVDDEKLMNARLALCTATGHVVRNVLEMLKIQAPEVM